MLDNINEQERPDYSGYYIGTVKFVDDPKKIERIKVTIPNLMEGDPEKLPWIAKKKAELFPDDVNATYGTFGLVPKKGDQVIVSFQDSNPLYGFYEACPHQVDERVAEALTNYLYRYGFKDPAGNLFMVDTKPNTVEILVQHVTGTLIKINNNGSVDIIVKDDLRGTVEKNSTINIQGNSNINVTGNSGISVTGNSSIQVTGTSNIASTGKTTISSGSMVQVTAPLINLN